MKKFTLLCCTAITLFCSTLWALTPEERVVVLHALEHAQKAKQENIDAWESNKQAWDNTAAAEQHAAETDKRADTLTGQIKEYQKMCEKIAAERDKMKEVYDQVTRWWDLGAFVWGVKQLMKHLFILVIVAAGLGIGIWALSFAFPLFGLAWAWIVKIIKKLLGMLKPRN